MPLSTWRRVQAVVYVPAALGTLYLTFPLIKGGIALGGKLLEKAADDDWEFKEVADDRRGLCSS